MVKIKKSQPVIRAVPSPYPGVVQVQHDGRTYTELCWCGCTIRGPVVDEKPDWQGGRIVSYCGTLHRDCRNDPGYPMFVPLPRKLKIRRKK